MANATAGQDETSSDEELKAEKKGLKEQMNSWKLCAAVGPIGMQDLDIRKRRKILRALLVVLCAGIVFTVLGVWGAYAKRKFGLHTLRWVSLHLNTGGDESAYAGIRVLCKDGGALQSTSCTPFSEVNCAAAYHHSSACLSCVERSGKMFIPVAMALITYLKLTHDTYERYMGIDSNCGKVGSLFCTLVGNTNFLFALLSYWTTCVKMLKTDITSAHIGPGFACIMIAALIKTVVGCVIFALPVQAFNPEDEKLEDTDEESD